MPFEPVLPSGSGQCREPAIHAVNRRAILEDAILWLTTDGRLPLAGWPSGQPQTGPTVDAADGHRRFGARTSDESQASRTQGLSLSSAGRDGPSARSHMGGRYHLCANADGVYVSGCHYRLVQSLRDRLGLSNTLDTAFCLEALDQALAQGKPSIFNSDQGVQFTSIAFTGKLEAQAIQISMDGRGRAFDNIFVERLWRTVKYEEVYLKEYASVVALEQGLAHYFTFYNQERPHQSLNYATPANVYALESVSS